MIHVVVSNSPRLCVNIIVGAIQDSQFNQQLLKEQKEIYRLRAKRLDEAKSGVLKVRKSKEAINEDLKVHQDKSQRLQEALIHLQEHLPAHQAYFRRLASIAADSKPV